MPEFRRHMVDLVHAGRSPEELSREFEAADPQLGEAMRPPHGRWRRRLRTAEWEDLNRLRCENHHRPGAGDIA